MLQPKPADSLLPARLRRLEDTLHALVTRSGPPENLRWFRVVDHAGPDLAVEVDSDDWVTFYEAATLHAHSGLMVGVEIDVPAGTTVALRVTWRGEPSVATEATGPIVAPLILQARPGWELVPRFDVELVRIESRRVAGAGAVILRAPTGIVAPHGEVAPS